MPLLFKWALKDGKGFNRKKFEVLKKTGLRKIGKACWRKKQGKQGTMWESAQ